MLKDFSLTINVVAPIFIFIFIGFVLRKTNVFSEETAEVLNPIVFSLLLPANLIRNLMYCEISAVVNVRLIVFVVLASVVAAAALSFFAPKIVKVRREAGSFVQCTFRANIVLMGLAFISNMCGEEGTIMMTSLIAFLVPTLNIISTVILSFFSGSGKPPLKLILNNAVKNPLIISCLIGIFISVSNIPTPYSVDKSIEYLSACSTPVAMFLIGSQFDTSKVIKHFKAVILACIIKLIILPISMTALAFTLGFRGTELMCVFVVFAAPSAASSAIQAQAEGCDGQMAGEILIATSLFSVLTIFVEVFLLYSLGLAPI